MKKEKEGRQNIFINIIIAFFAISVSFIIMETILRYTGYDYKRSPGPNSSYIIKTPEYRTIVRTNSLNMRDYEIRPKRKGEYRILCLGDSFTFGAGVEADDTYVKAMERILNRDDIRYRVINGGSGASAGAEYDFLIRKGLGLKPDLVIVQIFIGNDFYDAKSYLGPETDAPERKGTRALLKLKDLLNTHCYTAAFIWNRLVQIKYIDDLLLRYHLRYTDRGIYLREYPDLEKNLVRVELEYLEKIQGLCSDKGIKTLFMVIPSQIQILTKDLLNDEKYYYRKPNDLIKAFCQKRGIPYIDFLDYYEKLSYGDVRAFYYTIDIHWTQKGHEYAARVLANLIENG